MSEERADVVAMFEATDVFRQRLRKLLGWLDGDDRETAISGREGMMSLLAGTARLRSYLDRVLELIDDEAAR